jgi:hypothetical protein
MLVDVTDPIHYARHIIQEPRPGMAPKSIYMTEGIDSSGVGDSFSPPEGIEMHAVAMGLPLITNSQQRPIPEMTWPGGPSTITLSSSGLVNNLAQNKATGGLGQWAPALDQDGHFVVFDVVGARAQADTFIQSLGYESAAKLLPFQ